MSVPEEQHDEPTAPFVPLWDDDEAAPPGDDLPERVIVVRQPARPARPAPPEPVPACDETGPGALRPAAPEPVVETPRERTSRPPAARPSVARRVATKLRAASGLLILVLLTGVALAAAIGLTVAGLAFALRQAVGS